MITNFEYYPISVINTFGFPYDYSSIMHSGQSVRLWLQFLNEWKIFLLLKGIF